MSNAYMERGNEFLQFEDVYKHYHHDVYCFLLSMSRNPQVADELTQETFYRALKGIHKFKGGMFPEDVAMPDCEEYLSVLCG